MLLEQTPELGDRGREMALGPLSTAEKGRGTARRLRLAGFFAAVSVLVLCFWVPIVRLLRLAGGDDLYSDIPLIPLVSLYFVWRQRDRLPRNFRPSAGPAAFFFAAGAVTVGVYRLASFSSLMAIANYLAMNLTAMLFFLIGICFAFWGGECMRRLAFPAGLLVFTIPFPDFLRQVLDTFLQDGSAVAAGCFFSASGMPYLREGVNFELPGIHLQVAHECSGIHSSVVLLIMSLIAGALFLRSRWRRTALALAVIPLGLLRNGFRIFVIGQLCVHYGPQMLESPIHRHGGPLFFLLSLIPFFTLLLFLKRSERTDPKPATRK
jgi:exosortase C (VPDSG-CTERM-specific)